MDSPSLDLQGHFWNHLSQLKQSAEPQEGAQEKAEVASAQSRARRRNLPGFAHKILKDHSFQQHLWGWGQDIHFQGKV